MVVASDFVPSTFLGPMTDFGVENNFGFMDNFNLAIPAVPMSTFGFTSSFCPATHVGLVIFYGPDTCFGVAMMMVLRIGLAPHKSMVP